MQKRLRFNALHNIATVIKRLMKYRNIRFYRYFRFVKYRRQFRYRFVKLSDIGWVLRTPTHYYGY